MKLPTILALLTASAALSQTPAPPEPAAPQPDQQSSITVSSTLVLVPALVKTKSGDLVYTLTADDFLLTDDGIPQKLTLEQDTDHQPIALVVLVETGSDGAARLPLYKDLDPLLDNLVGNVPHQVALVGFDSTPTLLHGFTPNTTFIAHSLDNLDPGDPHAAILDALNFSVDLLRHQPTTYRRAILLLSETLDHGSHSHLEDALRAIADTNTAIYSVGFSSTRAQTADELHNFGYGGGLPPGPQHGCFSRDLGTDPDGYIITPTESRASQDLNCFSELLPPLRLAKLAYIAASNSLRRNVPETVARLTGGEYFHYRDSKSLQHDLLTIANHVPNRYVLSFHPPSPHPGLHALTLTLPNHINLKPEARVSYWADAPTTTPTQPPKP
jgi:VWFA-related protein